MVHNLLNRKTWNQVWRRFGVPMGMSVLTLAAAVAFIWDGTGARSAKYDGLQSILYAALCGLCFSFAGVLLSEAVKKERLRAACGVTGAVLGTGLYILCEGYATVTILMPGMLLTAGLLCCVILFRGEHPEKRLSQTLGFVFLYGAIILLVWLILYVLTDAVFSLFVSEADWALRNRVNETVMAAVWLLIAPYLLFSRFPDQETPKEKYTGLGKVLKWAVLPAYLALLAVLIGYIVMILARWEMPVGRINPYALLALGVFTALLLLLDREGNRMARFFSRWGAWLLLPVIIAQAVAVYIRISAYGFTEDRIYGVAFTLACLVPVVAALTRKRGRAFFVTGAVFMFVLTCTPLSAHTLARWDQEARLYSALERAGMLDADGTIHANEQASKEDQTIIWSSASLLASYRYRENAPENSRTASLNRQADAALEAYSGNPSVMNKLIVLFGFDGSDPVWSYRTYKAEGASTGSELDVAGFSHAKHITVYFEEKNDWAGELDGRTLYLSDFMPLADFETGTLSREDVVLSDGTTLRICYLSKTEQRGDSPYYYLNAWLLTP